MSIKTAVRIQNRSSSPGIKFMSNRSKTRQIFTRCSGWISLEAPRQNRSRSYLSFIYEMNPFSIGIDTAGPFVLIIIEIAWHAPECWPPVRYRWHFIAHCTAINCSEFDSRSDWLSEQPATDSCAEGSTVHKNLIRLRTQQKKTQQNIYTMLCG